MIVKNIFKVLSQQHFQFTVLWKYMAWLFAPLAEMLKIWSYHMSYPDWPRMSQWCLNKQIKLQFHDTGKKWGCGGDRGIKHVGWSAVVWEKKKKGYLPHYMCFLVKIFQAGKDSAITFTLNQTYQIISLFSVTSILTLYFLLIKNSTVLGH